MKKLFRRFICAGLAAVLSTAAVTASAASAADFTDVKPTAWYYNAVEYAAAENLFSGTGNGTFSPDAGMTRGMFVTVLGKKSGVSDAKPGSSRFVDVQIKDYFSPYTEWAAKYGIVSGTGNDRFSPNAKITREQMATILYGYAQKTGNDASIDPAKFNSFPDKGKVSRYAETAMQWAVCHGIINGSDGKLDPQGTATRAQVAQVFLNSKGVLVKTEITDGPVSDPEIPSVELLPEQEAMLAPEQDPQEVVRQVLLGTTAKWDPSLNEGNAFEFRCMGFGKVVRDEFLDPKYWTGSTDHAIYNTLEYLNDTGADRFFITAGMWGDEPSHFLTCYFTIPDKEDSALLKAAREIIEKKFPNAIFQKMGGVHGWRGHMQADSELSLAENAQQLAKQEIYYLSEWNNENDTFSYWISEPKPGIFYFFY